MLQRTCRLSCTSREKFCYSWVSGEAAERTPVFFSGLRIIALCYFRISMFLIDMVLETLFACPHVTALVTCEVILWVTLSALLTARLVHNLPDPGSLRGLLHLLADLKHVVLLPSHRSGYSSLLLDFLNSFILDPDMSKEFGPFQRRRSCHICRRCLLS